MNLSKKITTNKYENNKVRKQFKNNLLVKFI